MKSLLVGVLLVSLNSVFCNDVNWLGWAHDEATGIGPSTWASSWSGCSVDTRDQSPINIFAATSVYNGNLPGITFQNADDGIDMGLFNQMNLFRINLYSDVFYQNVVGNFTIREGFLYWGSSSNDGSEHEFCGEKSAAELHWYSTTANGDRNMLVTLFEETAENNTNFDLLIEALPDIATIPLNNFQKVNFLLNMTTFRSLFPTDASEYYEYDGTFSWPWCTPIRYTVFQNKVSISTEQLAVLRAFKFETAAGDVSQNGRIRPVQPLNSREVQSNKRFFPEFQSFWDYVEPKSIYPEIMTNFLTPLFESPGDLGVLESTL